MNRRTKSIISGVIIVALLIASVAGMVTLFNRDTNKIHSSAFSVGAINDQGIYEKSDKSIYTKELIECKGLTITPDFEAEGSFQVFYYDYDGAFLEATSVMEASSGSYKKDDEYPEARYCRIMITPDVPVDEDGNVDEDFKIRSISVISYANDYTITVNKNQNFKKPVVEETP